MAVSNNNGIMIEGRRDRDVQLPPDMEEALNRHFAIKKRVDIDLKIKVIGNSDLLKRIRQNMGASTAGRVKEVLKWIRREVRGRIDIVNPSNNSHRLSPKLLAHFVLE